jgi:hypothetical protein
LVCHFEIQKAATIFKPELIVYNAGTDVLEGDPLGRLLVSFSNLNLFSALCGWVNLKCYPPFREFVIIRLFDWSELIKSSCVGVRCHRKE